MIYKYKYNFYNEINLQKVSKWNVKHPNWKDDIN